MAAHYDDKVVPFPDESFRIFERELIKNALPHIGPRRVREILRQCVRDIRNHVVTETDE